APIPMLDIAQPTIPFTNLPLLDSSLAFMPRLSLVHSQKRGRAAADIDGEHSCLQKKKRRLRLFLITSRLSPQFSHPATNIVDRGSSKIAVWAKQKAMGRNLLRKAAILNRIRRGAVAARDAVSRRRLLVEQEKEQRQLEMARLTFNYGAIHTYTLPVHLPTEPIPPSTAIRNASHSLNPGSPLSSSPGSLNASRSPSPTSSSPPWLGPSHEAATDYKSPNAAYALSPPSIQSSTRTYEPHLPSPLGLSNYDAFDIEDLGAKGNTPVDLYSHLDDDEDGDDQFSFPWDADEEVRHDSPFSASVVTSDSRTTAATGTSMLRTPQQPAYDAFVELDKLDSSNEAADSAWPSPV
ncbi:hypothetical protein C7974DRAFT_293792, partial [Boeremia exigua]|uniref:uncharacterized protein n=1 Tax=Boeremia exigua TaxID=749465 RepID=UPI001E8D37C2